MPAGKPRIIQELKTWFKGAVDLSAVQAKVGRISVDKIEKIPDEGQVLDGGNSSTLAEQMRRFSLGFSWMLLR